MVIFKVRDLDHKNNTANKKVKFLSDISTLETEKKIPAKNLHFDEPLSDDK